MKLRTGLLLLFFCTQITEVFAQNPKWVKCRGRNIPGVDVYKHFSGQIGNRKVMLDLRFGYCGGSNYGGSPYYYEEQSGMKRLIIGEPDSFDVTIKLYAKDWADFDPKADKDENGVAYKGPRWDFKIIGRKLDGDYYINDKKEQQHIDLSEDYTSAYPLTVRDFNDTASHLSIMVAMPAAKSGTDGAYIANEEIMFLGGHDKESWSDFVKSCADKKMESVGLWPIYNDNGFLILEKEIYMRQEDKDGYAFLCLDVRNKKRLTIRDVMNLQGTNISELLEQAVRKQYNLGRTEKLSTWFRSETFPVTGNFIPTRSGLIFCYGIKDVVAAGKTDNGFFWGDPYIKIFLSYDELGDIIKKDFRKRVAQ